MSPASGPQHTAGHVACPACEEAKQQAMYGRQLSHLNFPEAAHLWLDARRWSTPTRRHHLHCIASLSKFFGDMKLRDIHIGNVAAYQKERQEEIRSSKRHRARKADPAECRESDGASRINHEISLLANVLAQAGLWAEIKRFYQPLPLPESIGMALTCDEEEHLFKVARSRPRWFIAYCAALISRGTTAGPGEIRHLRIGDIEIDGPHGSFLHVTEGVKNNFRKRPLPLNEDAKKAVLWLMERAAELGATEPQHYLLPHRAHVRGAAPDPDTPMGSWKKAHAAMCKEAAKKFPRLAHFRPYDYRHTASTDLLENPAISFTAIEHMMGHRISSHTKRKYDHLRNSALKVAADALNRGHTGGAAGEAPLRDREAAPLPDWKPPARTRWTRAESY